MSMRFVSPLHTFRRRSLLAALILIGPTLAACAIRSTSSVPPAIDRSVAGSSGVSAAVSLLRATLDAQVPAMLARYHATSVGVAVIEDGRVVLERAYGEQSAGVPATEATLFGLASVTKPVTAEVVLRLAAAGRLSLDESMSSAWVDPDVASDPRHLALTPRIALAHQTGLPNWRGHSPGGRLTFMFAPGAAFGYAGEGYDYVARFAEKKLRRTFEDLAEETVFAPLAMQSTSYSARGWMRGRLALPRDTAGRWLQPEVQDSGQWNAGNNMITTAGDYARFVVSVMRGDGLGPDLGAERLRSASGPQAEWSCRIAERAACPRASTMALGWRRLDYADGPVFVHSGRNDRPGGERTIAYFDPGRRRGAVILTSGTNGERLYHDILALIVPGAPIVAYVEPES